METNLTTKCRGCLAVVPEMHNLFNFLTKDLTLSNIISETTSIQIEENKEISPYLCIKCTGIVVDFYNFKIQFAKSEIYFQRELKKLKEDSLTRFIILSNQPTVSEEVTVKDNAVVDNIKDTSKNLLDTQKTKETRHINLSKNLPPLNTTVSSDENKHKNSYSEIPEPIKHMTPEVGEFTVQNELVQLIESVVFCCKRCNKEYLLKDDFLNHMSSEHDKIKVVASKFTKKTLVKLFLGKVIEENSEDDFELDNDNQEKEQKLCKFCNTLVIKSEYEHHHDEHKTHICHCGAKFLRKGHLVNHDKSVHSDARHFKCKYCDKAFKSKQCLTKHVRYHTHPRSEICHICGQIFNDKSVLSTHIKLKHFPTRNFQCSQCGLKFPLKSTLEKHFRRHHTSDRKKMFSCTQCNMTYFEKCTLNRHISVKHSDQPVQARCEYCGKTFTTKGNLYKHLRISHKYDRVLIGQDGNITVQKGADLMKAPNVNNVGNFVLEHRVI